MKNRVCLCGSIVVALFLLTGCPSYWVGHAVSEMPRFWSGYTWQAISWDEAESLWGGYDTAHKPVQKATVYEQYYGKSVTVFYDCPLVQLETETDYVATGFVVRYGPGVQEQGIDHGLVEGTFFATDESERGAVFQAAENHSVIKYLNQTDAENDTHAIYKNGWLVNYYSTVSGAGYEDSMEVTVVYGN